MFLVLVLAWLAVDPAAHHAIHADEHAACDHAHSGHAHDDDAATDDHGCVVSQFAHGQIGVFVAPRVLTAPTLLRVEACRPQDDLWRLVRPHELPPGCGPPAA